jgi:hypothetical protein
MNEGHGAVRAHVWDAVKATPVASMLGWLVSGHTISYAAGLVGFLYTCLVTHQKLKEMGVYRWISRRVHPEPVIPRPPGRTAQDE